VVSSESIPLDSISLSLLVPQPFSICEPHGNAFPYPILGNGNGGRPFSLEFPDPGLSLPSLCISCTDLTLALPTATPI
jgi:hypothetical protein